MINLETRPLKDVPIGGLFIYEAISEDEMGKEDIAYHLYKKGKAGYGVVCGKLMWSTKTGERYKGSGYLFNHYEPVAYTGIIMQG